MPTVRTLALTLLITVSAIAPSLAQTRLPEPIIADATAETGGIGVTAPTATAPLMLPNAPTPQKARVIDKRFMAVIGALAGTETLRFTTHKLVLDNEYAAGAPWVTSVPQNSHLVAKYGAIFAAEFVGAYELKKPHDWLPGDRIISNFWWAYPVALSTIHFKNGVKSIRTQAPTSCPVELCGAQ